MEHNEYAVHELKLRFNRTTTVRDGNDDFLHNEHQVVEEVQRYVAPAKGVTEKHFGQQLIQMHLDEAFRFAHPLDGGARYEVIEQKEFKLEAIIRYSDQYRDRI